MIPVPNIENFALEHPADYYDLKRTFEELAREMEKLAPGTGPLVVCVGNRAFFNLK